jgi:putative peptidoglycan lipid II flippase
MSKPKTDSLGRSSGKISLATAGSRVAGLLRETVFAYLLGGSVAADAYFAATRIPNLMRDLFAEGALGAAFVPVLSETLSRNEVDRARALVRNLGSTLALGVGLLVALGIVAAPWLVRALTPGFATEPGKTELTILLVRWTFPYLWLISLSALVAGTLNALRRFGVPASAPIFFNLAHIATAVLFYTVFDPPVLALAVGVTVGALAQLLFQWPALRQSGFSLLGGKLWGDPLVGRVLKLMVPVMLGLATLQLNNLISTLIASFLPGGSLAYLNYAFRLMHFPLGVFAVAIGTAILPRATEAVTLGDSQALQTSYNDGLKLATFLVVPAALFLILFPEAIVSVIYQRGAFTQADTLATASALRFYALGLLGYAGVRVTAPIFYAHKDTRTPMVFAMWAVGVNVALNIALVVPMGIAGLALANALAGSVNFLLLRRRLHVAFGMGVSAAAWKDISAFLFYGILAAAVAWLVWRAIPADLAGRGFAGRTAMLAITGAVFALSYLWPVLWPESATRRVLNQLLRRPST